MRGGRLLFGLLIGGVATTGAVASAATVRVTQGEAQPQAVRRVLRGPDAVNLHRYHLPPAKPDSVPRQAVTRQTYIDFLQRQPWWGRPGTSYRKAFLANPKRGRYAPRHCLPALALFVATGDRELGEACKTSLKDFLRAVKQVVKEKGWHEYYMHHPSLIELEFRVLQEHGILTDEDEPWMRELVLYLSRTVHVWNNPKTFWRGPMHRAQGEGMMKRLAVRRYPDAPEAEEWAAYSDRVWRDWWDYRDTPTNNTGYFYGQAFPVILGAHLLGRTEVFTDPGMKPYWERLAHEVSPDGAISPYGTSSGWNAGAGQRLWMLELAARHTGDGTYRWVAHRLMDYLLFQEQRLPRNHALGHEAMLGVGLAYLLADESIEPVKPDPGSRLLTRKETLRVRGKEAAAHYLQDLDPDPNRAHICCRMIVTDRVLPSKLVLRSGWEPGDLFMLVELFPRFGPSVNPAGVVGFTQNGSTMARAIGTKAPTMHENLLVLEDLSGTASVVTNPNPHTTDPYYMDVTVEALEDFDLATYARVRHKDYLGFPATAWREFFFIKNRFVYVCDRLQVREGFLARVGPVWHAQNVAPQVGPNWANLYFHAPVNSKVRLKNPPRDLLFVHAPGEDRRIRIRPRNHQTVSWTAQHQWEGVLDPDRTYRFPFVLLPHEPTPRPETLAEGIAFLRNTPEQTVVRLTVQPGRTEWIVLNPAGKPVKLEGLATDARRLYLDLPRGKPPRILAQDASYLSAGDRELFRHADRRTVQR